MNKRMQIFTGYVFIIICLFIVFTKQCNDWHSLDDEFISLIFAFLFQLSDFLTMYFPKILIIHWLIASHSIC